jgi:SAM-dependent methyltransferase
MACKNGLSMHPDVVAELGPGDSIGTGLSALISGANKYYALDVIKYADTKKNIEIFDELVDLFQRKEKVPGDAEFPKIKPRLESYEFPKHVLTDEHLDRALEQKRLTAIRNQLLNLGRADGGDIQIHYCVPWHDLDVIQEDSVDMLYSQAVLEHIDDLDHLYEGLHRWLKPGGLMSHEIDFKSHGTAKIWNGHWAYSDFVWKLIRGRKPCLLNRQPYSVHEKLLQKLGFEVICDIKTENRSGITRKRSASKFENIPEEDFIISSVFIQALKKTNN